MEITVKVINLEGVKAKLRELGPEIGGKTLGDAMETAAEIFRETAAQKAPVYVPGFDWSRAGRGWPVPGQLGRSIEIKRTLARAPYGQMGYMFPQPRITVGPSAKQGWYGHWVEFGTKAAPARYSRGRAHRIYSVDMATGREVVTIKRTPRHYRAHHATRANPYLRPTMDEKAEEYGDAVAAELDRALDRFDWSMLGT